MARKRIVLPPGTLDNLKQAITDRISTSLSEQLREQPEAVGRLVELGVIDPDFLSNPADLDLQETIRRFRDLIAERAATEPSVLAQLEVRPLELMRQDDPETFDASEATSAPLTVVFSDLEGFTGFTSERGDLEASALLSDHYDTVESITRSRGGRVIKKLGDGHMLSFREPSAAVLASLELTSAAPGPLRLRAGAHRGTVIELGDDLFGHVVNVASRVADLASGGTSLITRDVRSAVGTLPTVSFGVTRAVRLDGLAEPVEISEVSVA